MKIRIGLPLASQNFERFFGPFRGGKKSISVASIIGKREGHGRRRVSRRGAERVEFDSWETCNSIARQRNESVWAKYYVHGRCKWFSKDEPGGCTTFTISTGLARQTARSNAYPQGRRESLCNTFTMQLRTSVRTTICVYRSNDGHTCTQHTPTTPAIIINRSNTASRSPRSNE